MKSKYPRPSGIRTVMPALIVLIGSINEKAMAQHSRDQTEKNKSIVNTAFAGWTNGTAIFFDLLDPAASWTITGTTPLSGTYHSKAEFIDQVIDPLNRRFEKRIVPTVKGIYADGDMVIALWDGEAMATDGKPYRSSYSWYMKMKEGKIINVIAFLDGIEFTSILQRIPDDNSRAGTTQH